MKLVILACLAAVAVAAPQLQDVRPIVQVIRDERQDDANGNFKYAIEADNGIYMVVSGTPGSQGQSNIEGVYWLPSPDGTFEEVRFVANEFGFQPESSLLPTPHPLPAHAQEQIRVGAQQRTQGIVFE